MGSINATLLGASSALKAFQSALSAAQNNIDNASTPGYARQTASLVAEAFDPATGLAGGVANGPLLDSRDPLAERDVWLQAGAQGDANAQTTALGIVQNAMPVAQGSGLSNALSNFFSEASAWSAAPTSSSAQQDVIVAAGSLAQSFRTTAAAVSAAATSIGNDINTTVGQINSAISQIASLNKAIQSDGQQDAGMQAKLYSTLESLSGEVNINVLQQSDGSVMVTLSNGAALVVGQQGYPISTGQAAASSQSIDAQAPPDVVIRATDGTPISAEITQGSLAGLLKVRNQTIPSLIGDASQPGALNTLAATLAKAVNSIVSQGSTTSGGAATEVGLFTDPDPAHPTGTAAGMAVNPGISNILPPVDQSGEPNGVPLAIAALANAAPSELGSVGYTIFYGNAASLVGSQLDQAQSDQTLSNQTLAQAQSMRQNVSGVSLDAEAITVLQFQAGYQAVAKMVNTLTTLTQSVINMLQ